MKNNKFPRERLEYAISCLREYRAAKAPLESRIREEELWWQLRHWEVMGRDEGEAPASAWLFNNLSNKHADAMDNFPEPAVLPREPNDAADAELMSRIIPAVMERSGFEKTYSDNWWYKEIMDIRLNDEEYLNSDTLKALQSVCPDDIEFFAVKEPLKPTKEIGYSEYVLCLDEFTESDKNALKDFLKSESIICQKVGKKGKIKEIDLIPKIKEYKIEQNNITFVLVAGSEDNLNPTLIMDTFFECTGIEKIYYTVFRTAILDKQGNTFK